MFEGANLFVSTAGLFIAVFSAVWSLAWWLSGKFSKVEKLVYTMADKVANSILSKLEYHERHDDDRFSQIREDLSEIRVRNAAKDSLMASLATRMEKMS